MTVGYSVAWKVCSSVDALAELMAGHWAGLMDEMMAAWRAERLVDASAVLTADCLVGWMVDHWVARLAEPTVA